MEEEIEQLLAKQHDLLKIKETLEEEVAANERAPKADWQGLFLWDSDAEEVLRRDFKLKSFRYSFMHAAS